MSSSPSRHSYSSGPATNSTSRLLAAGAMGASLLHHLVVAVALLLTTAAPSAKATIPHISAIISQSGLDFAKDLLVSGAVETLTPLSVPDIERSVNIPLVGTVRMVASGIVLHSLAVANSTVAVGDTGVVVTASLASANITMEWSYSYSAWVVTISDSGNASIQVYRCFQQPYQIFSGKCNCEQIMDRASKLDSFLRNLPKKIDVDNAAAMNVTFVNDPLFKSSSVEFDIDGLFIPSDRSAVPRHMLLGDIKFVPPLGSSSKMLWISLDEDVFNSVSSLYFKSVAVSGAAVVSGNNLGGRVELDYFSFTLKWSKVGKIHTVVVQPSSPKPNAKPLAPSPLATVHPAPQIATLEMAATSLFSLPSLRLLSRASGSSASRFQTLAARKQGASTVVSGGGGGGGGLLSVLDRALADEEEYRRARAQVQRKGVEAEGYAIEGLSVGGHETCVTVPSLNVAFDIGRGPNFAVSQDYLFITHAHLDHIVSTPDPALICLGSSFSFIWFAYAFRDELRSAIAKSALILLQGGLPMYIATRGLYNLKPPTVFVPPCIKDDVEELLQVHRRMSQVELNVELVALDLGETYEIRNDLVARPFQTYHAIPSQGYIIYSIRKKLKKQYAHLKGSQIAKLKQSGAEITDTILYPEVAFTGDTKSDFIIDPRNADALRAKVLITEATFLDDHVDVEHAREHGHMHLSEIMEHSQWFRNKTIILTHFSNRIFDRLFPGYNLNFIQSIRN
ncbi:hypothetical protein PR202_gb22259 [Eleusine coracana subsp. coracana]|uniref:Metallo-beta-lactamase domain-containing protein n=1 Tax=Eleusine coracana subsp. coracana TaxID=191504 RepID=A0AAV5FG28_ELECO|nr:hypothetical protein PR202_gb22259 [Eleusine coracana subsp. coracana]